MSKKQRPRSGVVICGAYGMGNAGDDAVLEAIVAALRRLGGDMPVTVMARRPKTVAARFGVSAVHPLRVLRWYRSMRRAALFLSGGGTLLQDVTSRRSLTYYLTAIRLAGRAGCAVQLYGCGVGPLSGAGRTRTAAALNACAAAATLRDPDSLELLRSIGVTRPRLLLAADPALSLPAPAGDRERTIGFALREWPDFSEHAAAFAAAARYAWETYKLSPVFLCFTDADRTAARAVIARLDGVPCSISQSARRACRMGLVVSMRLHGLVFALRGGVPAVGVSYDPKVDSFCREAGYPCLSLEDVTKRELCRRIDEASHLDGEALAAAAETLRHREGVNAHAAAELLAEISDPLRA